MVNWNYQRDESSGFQPLPEGKYRIRIKEAESAISSNGNDMLVLQFEVSGSNKVIWHYIVFLPDRPEITNRMLTQFFESFKDIQDGDFDTAKWIGKVGACKIKHEEYNGDMKEKISYFISADRQGDLPPWSSIVGVSGDNKKVLEGFEPVDDDLPF